MWMVEAKTAGENPQYFRYGPTTEKQAHLLHNELANSGEWSSIRVWDLDAEREQEDSDARIKEYFQSLEDGAGEGQPL